MVWFAVTPCVYLLARYVDFVIRVFITAEQIVQVFKRLLSSKKNCHLLLNYYPRGWFIKQAGTTTLVYRIVINCTTAESVLKLISTVSTSLLQSSSRDTKISDPSAVVPGVKYRTILNQKPLSGFIYSNITFRNLPLNGEYLQLRHHRPVWTLVDKARW